MSTYDLCFALPLNLLYTTKKLTLCHIQSVVEELGKYILAERSQRRAEGFFFDSYYTEVYRRELLLSWIAPLTLDMYLIMLSVKQGAIK